MADKKIEKALYGPSTTEVALGAILGFLLGVVVACVYLVWKPVQRVVQMPKEPVPNVVYFLPGTENSTKGRAWQAKLKTLTNGGAASFNEEELNAFASTIEPPPVGTAPKAPDPAKPAKPGDAAKPAEPAKPQGDVFTCSDLNFHILKDDKLQISLKCAVNYYGIGTDVYVLATGTFGRVGESYVFQPDTYYFGSCPLHKLPVGSVFITSRILGAFKLPDSMRAWDKISSIKIEGGLMKVTTTP
jgi:hypothetical protein